jgi:hypothetical protein
MKRKRNGQTSVALSLINLKNELLEGGFQLIQLANLDLNILAGTAANNCNGGNCVSGCGKGQNVVAGCGTNQVPFCGG